MASHRTERIMNMLKKNVDDEKGNHMTSSSNCSNHQKNFASAPKFAASQESAVGVRKTSELVRNVTSSSISNLELPMKFIDIETSTLTGSCKFYSYYDILHRSKDTNTWQQDEENNVGSDSDHETSSSATDPFYTDHDSDDPDFIPIDENQNILNENPMNTEKKKKTRKRQKLIDTWRRNVIKKSRNSGAAYMNWKGKAQPERRMKSPCQNCRSKCREKISEDARKGIFTEFWSLGDINRQRDLISKLVKCVPKQRSRKRTKVGEENECSHMRQVTYTYWLRHNETTTSVCKTFFLNTLGISGQMVQTVFAKMGSSGAVLDDRRGKACQNSKLDESVKDSVRSHINSFSTVESHYCRKSTERKYLPSTLNISKMYVLYQEYCQENNFEKRATESIYRQIFNGEFNISFFQPKKDLCDTCHMFQNATDQVKTEMEEKYTNHLKNRDVSRQLKNSDKDSACQNSTLCVAVFDLQQVLPTPKSNVGLAYYKLKLSTYNFTVYNLATRACQCYMWYECIAKRGSSEIGSCLLLYIRDQMVSGAKEFSFYSDNCSGQNRNKNLFALYNYLSQIHSIKIRHTFLEPGHTQSEGDCVHSVIEKASRNIPVFTPEQWYSVVRTAKRSKPIYSVHELSQLDVYDLKDLQQQTAINFDKNEKNDKIYMSKFKIIEFDPDIPNTLLFKMEYSQAEYDRLNLIQKGRRKIQVDMKEIQLKPLYNSKLPLQKKKYDHLMYLCSRGVITAQYHDFFKNLPFCSAQQQEEEDCSE